METRNRPAGERRRRRTRHGRDGARRRRARRVRGGGRRRGRRSRCRPRRHRGRGARSLGRGDCVGRCLKGAPRCGRGRPCGARGRRGGRAGLHAVSIWVDAARRARRPARTARCRGHHLRADSMVEARQRRRTTSPTEQACRWLAPASPTSSSAPPGGAPRARRPSGKQHRRSLLVGLRPPRRRSAPARLGGPAQPVGGRAALHQGETARRRRRQGGVPHPSLSHAADGGWGLARRGRPARRGAGRLGRRRRGKRRPPARRRPHAHTRATRPESPTGPSTCGGAGPSRSGDRRHRRSVSWAVGLAGLRHRDGGRVGAGPSPRVLAVLPLTLAGRAARGVALCRSSSPSRLGRGRVGRASSRLADLRRLVGRAGVPPDGVARARRCSCTPP